METQCVRINARRDGKLCFGVAELEELGMDISGELQVLLTREDSVIDLLLGALLRPERSGGFRTASSEAKSKVQSRIPRCARNDSDERGERGVVSTAQLPGKVICQAKILDQAQLSFEIIDVPFFVVQVRQQKVGAALVSGLSADGVSLVVVYDGRVLTFEINRELIRHALTRFDFRKRLHVGRALEEENAFNQLFRVFHLFDGALLREAAQCFIAPVIAHLGVQDVLNRGPEFLGQRSGQNFQYLRFTLHGLLAP
jgi:hypothetical protein